MEQSTKRKKIATIRSTPSANRAAPPPISGQALGQYGLNIANSRKNPNERTRNIREHVYIPTRVEVHRMPSQNSLEITVKSPSSTYPSKQTATANLSKGSSAKKSRGRFIPSKETHHSAISKKCDPRPLNPKAIRKTSIGSAKSIGSILRQKEPRTKKGLMSKQKSARSKPHRNTGTIGHADHGKTTLTAAIPRVSAEQNKAKFPSHEQIDSAPEEKARGITIATAHVEYETDKRHHTHIDRPGHADHAKNTITGAAQTDGAIPVVSATDGPMPQTREHIPPPRQIGVPATVVHANKVDPVADKTMPEIVESEVRDPLTSHKYQGSSIPVTFGSAPAALNNETPPAESIKRLPTATDESIPQPFRPVDQPFPMPVEDVFSIGGRGTVVTGKIERGTIKIGEESEIVGSSEPTRTTCTGIETFHKVLDHAEAGENVGVSSRGIKRTDIERGQVLSAPKTMKAYLKSEAQVHVPSKEEGGRHTPFFPNHRPQLSRRTADITGIIHLPDNIKMVLPGDHVSLTIESIAPIAPNEGSNLAIREGGKTVGAGVVVKCLLQDRPRT